MGNDSGPDADDFDVRSFEQWLERISEEKGVPKGEIVDEMMSSYWILDDLASLASDAGDVAGDTETSDETSAPRPEGSTETPQRTPSEDRGSSDSADGGDGFDSELADVRRTIQLVNELNRDLDDIVTGTSQRESAGVDEAELEKFRRRLDAAEDDLEWVASTLERLYSRLAASDDRADTLAGWFERLNGDVDDAATQAEVDYLAERLDDVDEAATERHEALRRDVRSEFDRVGDVLEDLLRADERLEAELDETAGREALEAVSEHIDDLEAEVETLEEETATRHETLRRDVRAEFERLRDVLDHLVDTDEQQEAALDTLQTAYNRDVPSLLDVKREFHDAADLKARANEVGVTTAACEDCGTSVDLRLLARPRCPNCEAPFDDVSPKSGWLRGRNTLVTRSERDPPTVDDVPPE